MLTICAATIVLTIEFLEQRAHQCGLARSDLPGDDEEALALVDPELQVRKRAGVALAAEEERWDRG